MRKNILIFPSAEETAEALAEFLVREISDNIARRGGCTVALSGGNTPRSLFRVLAGKYHDAVKWPSVDLFWVDERCVPPDNIESNYLMTRESLLDKIDIPVSNIHRIAGEEDPAEEALRYSAEITRYTEMINGLPSFDIILLGMGDDGHTASIFPGSENLFMSDEICIPAIHPVTGQKRITITGKIINNASTVVIFVTGKSKAVLLADVLGGGNTERDYPILHVAPPGGKLYWYLDREAASGV